ncbi:MAG: ATP-binding protein, partial [Burkholderiaceae bacterium]|nr:ATP-binding protein [Burkholderiaceae bacterium]
DFGDIAEAGTAVLDPNLAIISTDLGFCRLMGRDARSLAGRALTELLLSPRSGQLLFDELRAAPGSARCTDLDFVRLDGNVFCAHAQLQSVGVGAACIVITVQDRGRRERLGAELRARLTQLEQMQHRIDRAGQYMQQAERLSSVGEAATGVAAALREPTRLLESHLATLDRYLTSLFGVVNACDAAEGLLEGQHPARALLATARFAGGVDFIAADARVLMNESRASLTRLRQLVDSLGALAPDAVERWQWQDLRSAIDTTLALVTPCHGDHVRFSARTEALGTTARLFCVPAELQQVLLNLVNNAAQSLDGRAGEVEVVARRDGDRVLLSVRDSGRGIDPAARARLFEPLFTTRDNGSGLGLSLVKDIVTRHGGSIEVDSAPGQGATFIVTLPVDPRTASEDRVERDALFAAAA